MDMDRKEILVIEGSRSPDSLQSLPISVVSADEVDGKGRSFNLANNPMRFSAHLMLFCFVKNRGSQ